jgi:hypothetical protein
VTSYDELTAFLEWWAKAPNVGFVPFDSPVHYIDGVTCVTLYRKAPFQVQMFIVPPDYIIAEHTHPNVDSYEVYCGGNINFSHSQKWVAPQEMLVPDEQGLAKMRGQYIRVRPNDLHGGTFGPQGGVFMSVQHWLNGLEPTCVASDYIGVVSGPEHLAHVKTGAPVFKEVRTPKDAAGLE